MGREGWKGKGLKRGGRTSSAQRNGGKGSEKIDDWRVVALIFKGWKLTIIEKDPAGPV